jgi:hypothetical protein
VFKSFIWPGIKTRMFIVGALCGAVLAAAGETAYVWWRAAHPPRSAEDNLTYEYFAAIRCASSRVSRDSNNS